MAKHRTRFLQAGAGVCRRCGRVFAVFAFGAEPPEIAGGLCFGQPVEAVLIAQGVTHKREATTEKRNGPDFRFPGEGACQDANQPAAGLRMLAAGSGRG